MKSATEIQQQLTQTIKAKHTIEKKLQHATNALQIAHKKIQTLTQLLQQQSAESRYRSMMENMELGIMEVDNDEVITKAYPMFCKMIGYTEKELIGKNAKTLFVPEGLNTYYAEQTSNRVQGHASTYEMQILNKQGEKIWVIISGVPIFDATGKTIGSIGIHYDITARKKLEQDLAQAKEIAEQAQKAEQQFLANMSHEIRTPLNSIVGMSSLLKSANTEQERITYIEIIEKAAYILQGLITNILDFSKIEANTVELIEKPFEIRKLLHNLKATFAARFQSRNIECTLHIDEALPEYVIGDEIKLTQILFNLLGNAEKFTEKGSIQLHANLQSIHKKIATIQLIVQDTGIGIPTDKHAYIFEKFKQIPGETNAKNALRGVGLGLAITKKLVQLMKGSIAMESVVDKGTKFIIRIPLQIHTNKLAPQQTQNTTTLPQLKLLIAEDSEMNRTYLSILLKKWDINFVFAENGKEAIDALIKDEYDAILMDVQMPIMDGFEATEYIRSLPNKNQASIPIIGLSASALSEYKKRGEQCGMNDYLTKPFTPSQLKEILLNVVVRQQKKITLKKPSTNFTDEDEFQQYFGCNYEYAAKTFEVFIQNILPEIDNLENIYDTKGINALQHLVHKIKPLFQMIGLKKIKDKLDTLELNCNKEISDKKVKTAITKIVVEVNKAKPIIVERYQHLLSMIAQQKKG